MHKLLFRAVFLKEDMVNPFKEVFDRKRLEEAQAIAAREANTCNIEEDNFAKFKEKHAQLLSNFGYLIDIGIFELISQLRVAASNYYAVPLLGITISDQIGDNLTGSISSNTEFTESWLDGILRRMSKILESRNIDPKIFPQKRDSDYDRVRKKIRKEGSRIDGICIYQCLYRYSTGDTEAGPSFSGINILVRESSIAIDDIQLKTISREELIRVLTEATLKCRAELSDLY